MRNFREYDIWVDSMSLAKQLYTISLNFPDYEKFGLIAQIKRAVTSIPSNIAEGSAKTSPKDFGRFLEISLGSCFELETQIELAFSFQFITMEIYKEIKEKVISLEKRISALILSLK